MPRATEVLSAHKETLVRLAQTLIVEETLEADRLEAVFKGPDSPATPLTPVPKPGSPEPPAKPAAEARKPNPVISPFPKQAPAS